MMQVIRLRLSVRGDDRVFGVDTACTADPAPGDFFALKVENDSDKPPIDLRLHPVDAYRLHRHLGELLQYDVQPVRKVIS